MGEIGSTVVCKRPDLAVFERCPARSMPVKDAAYEIIGRVWSSRNPNTTFLRLSGLPKSRVYCADGFEALAPEQRP